MTLTASGNVGGQSDISAVADVHTNEAISYAKTGPVFNLPDGDGRHGQPPDLSGITAGLNPLFLMMGLKHCNDR